MTPGQILSLLHRPRSVFRRHQVPKWTLFLQVLLAFREIAQPESNTMGFPTRLAQVNRLKIDPSWNLRKIPSRAGGILTGGYPDLRFRPPKRQRPWALPRP